MSKKNISAIMYSYNKDFIKKYSKNIVSLENDTYYSFSVLGIKQFIPNVDKSITEDLEYISKNSLPLPLDLMAAFYFKGDEQTSLDAFINYFKQNVAFDIECFVSETSIGKVFYCSNKKFMEKVFNDFIKINKISKVYGIKQAG